MQRMSKQTTYFNLILELYYSRLQSRVIEHVISYLFLDYRLVVFYRCLRLTIPSYGTSFLDFYRQSDFPLFQMLASLLHVGTSVMEGLQEATEKKY